MRVRHQRAGQASFVRPVNRWIVEALVLVLVGSLTYSAVTGIQAANRANCCFPLALLALPPGSDPEPNYLTLNAAELNRTQPQRPEYPLKVRYVGSDVPSDSPSVISVNPIDPFTWAAVAVGTDGRCYGLLVALDPAHPVYGNTYYVRFPARTPCRGAKATTQTVTLRQLPEGLS
jgi:hypothetical protein